MATEQQNELAHPQSTDVGTYFSSGVMAAAGKRQVIQQGLQPPQISSPTAMCRKLRMGHAS